MAHWQNTKTYGLFAAVLLLLVMAFGSACTYTRPLIALRTGYETVTDSQTYNRVKIKTYTYLTFRKLAIVGKYTRRIDYDSLGHKLSLVESKKIPSYIYDGKVRTFSKRKLFNASGQLIRIDKRICQSHGVYGSPIVNKTILIQDGKRIKQNNKNNIQ